LAPLVLLLLFFGPQTIFSQGLNLPKIEDAEIQKGEGFITKCSYRVGNRICGSCYCLKANPGSILRFNGRKLRGCARLDVSRVGSLEAFVGKDVYYEGTSDFDSTFICPQHFKLFTIRLLDEQIELPQ